MSIAEVLPASFLASHTCTFGNPIQLDKPQKAKESGVQRKKEKSPFAKPSAPALLGEKSAEP
jgi:hypothetical protein